MTVNIKGNVAESAKNNGYYAYYADGVTSVEVRQVSKREARKIAKQFGQVLFIFE